MSDTVEDAAIEDVAAPNGSIIEPAEVVDETAEEGGIAVGEKTVVVEENDPQDEEEEEDDEEERNMYQEKLETDRSNRFDFLVSQTEIFTHFITTGEKVVYFLLGDGRYDMIFTFLLIYRVAVELVADLAEPFPRPLSR